MKRLLRKLAAEWEKVLFWLSLLTLVALLGTWLYGKLSEGSGIMEKRKDGTTRGSLLGANALAFLEPLELDQLEGGNPFAFVRRIQAFGESSVPPWRKSPDKTRPEKPFPKRRPKQNAPVKPAGKPKPTEAKPPPRKPEPAPKPEPPKNTEPVKPAPPPKPTGPPPARLIRYKGFHKGPSGVELAYVWAKDPAQKTTQGTASFLTKGSTLAKGLRIGSFDRKTLHILVGNTGKEETVAIGDQKKIILE